MTGNFRIPSLLFADDGALFSMLEQFAAKCGWCGNENLQAGVMEFWHLRKADYEVVRGSDVMAHHGRRYKECGWDQLY